MKTNFHFLFPGSLAMALRLFSLVALLGFGQAAFAQVGIGTESPEAQLHVYNGSILGTTKRQDPGLNPFYSEEAPDSVDMKLKWIHEKAALRSVGHIYNSDPLLNVGLFSFASGFEVFATGSGSTALGLFTASKGDGALSSGVTSYADGYAALAVGFNAHASGNYSVALGSYVNTNTKIGAFVFGDNSVGALQSSANNQFKTRFAGGYQFYTNAAATIGVSLAPGGNSWTTISDRNKKENFLPIDGESVLKKINAFNLTSWNYKGQDPKMFRHYGPMAQDFFQAFGKDEIGVAGSDTTINQADFEGINLVAIQALIRRTEELQRSNTDLLVEVATLKQQVASMDRGSFRKKRRILLGKK